MAVVCLADSPAWLLYSPRMHCSLSVIYLAGALRAAGHEVRILDAHAITSWDGRKMTVNHQMLPECDVLGMSATSANVNWGAEVASAWPARIKVLGGRHVTDVMKSRQKRFHSPRYFPEFDYIMAGECEETLVDFCDRVDRREHFQGINGLYQVLGSEDLLYPWGLPFPRDPDVTKLPTPAFDLWEAGFEAGALRTRDGLGAEAGMRQTCTMFSARGCNFSCTFCSDRQTKIRSETMRQVRDQCELMVSLGIGAVRIADDIFTLFEKRAMEIADMLHSYGIMFRATTRVNLKNPSLFRHLYSRGCTELGFGVEHPSDFMLKAMMKGTTSKANDDAIHMAQDAGIAAQAFLIAGFPGETVETLDYMRDWIPRCKPDGVVFSLFQPYALTTPFEFPEKYGVSVPDDCFDHFWQIIGDGEEEPVLTLPTISRRDLLEKRKEIQGVIDSQIRNRDRRKALEDVCA